MSDDYPQCGACDETGNPIHCSECYWEDKCRFAKDLEGEEWPGREQ